MWLHKYIYDWEWESEATNENKYKNKFIDINKRNEEMGTSKNDT